MVTLGHGGIKKAMEGLGSNWERKCNQMGGIGGEKRDLDRYSNRYR